MSIEENSVEHALKLVLEALKTLTEGHSVGGKNMGEKAIKYLEEALAKQEQCEQQLVPLDDEGFVSFTKARENATQQLPSKGEACRSDIKPLTDEQIDDLARTMVKGNKSVNWLARAIEAAHGITEEKNT